MMAALATSQAAVAGPEWSFDQPGSQSGQVVQLPDSISMTPSASAPVIVMRSGSMLEILDHTQDCTAERQDRFRFNPFAGGIEHCDAGVWTDSYDPALITGNTLPDGTACAADTLNQVRTNEHFLSYTEITDIKKWVCLDLPVRDEDAVGGINGVIGGLGLAWYLIGDVAYEPKYASSCWIFDGAGQPDAASYVPLNPRLGSGTLVAGKFSGAMAWQSGKGSEHLEYVDSIKYGAPPKGKLWTGNIIYSNCGNAPCAWANTFFGYDSMSVRNHITNVVEIPVSNAQKCYP